MQTSSGAKEETGLSIEGRADSNNALVRKWGNFGLFDS